MTPAEKILYYENLVKGLSKQIADSQHVSYLQVRIWRKSRAQLNKQIHYLKKLL